MRVLVYHQNIGYHHSAELSNREPTSMHTVQILGIMNSKQHAGRPGTNEVTEEHVSEAFFKSQGKSVRTLSRY